MLSLRELINSTMLSFYFVKSFGTYKKLFPRILIEKIKELPIIVPTTDYEKENAKKIMESVELLLKKEKEEEHLQKQLDLLVFDLYQIPENTQKYIMNYIDSLNS